MSERQLHTAQTNKSDLRKLCKNDLENNKILLKTKGLCCFSQSKF